MLKPKFFHSKALAILLVLLSACGRRTINNETIREIHDPVAPTVASPHPTTQTQIKSGTTSTSMSAPASSFGGVSDGGGNAVVCRKDGQVISAEVLDLYEARIYQGWTVKNFAVTKSYLEIAKSVAENLDRGGAGVDNTGIETDTSFDGTTQTVTRKLLLANSAGEGASQGGFTRSTLEELDKKKRLLPSGNKLRTIADSNSTVLPSDNCHIEQLAVYRDNSNRLYIVGDIWEKLNNINRAALLVHEALYRRLRVAGEPNSDRTRSAVGLAFTDYQFESIQDGIPKNPVLCWSDDPAMSYRFAIIPDAVSEGVTLQFLYLEGKLQLTKTTLRLDRSMTPFGYLPDKFNAGNFLYVDLQSKIDEDPVLAIDINRDENHVKHWTMMLPILSIPSTLKYTIQCNRDTL